MAERVRIRLTPPIHRRGDATNRFGAELFEELVRRSDDNTVRESDVDGFQTIADCLR